MTSFSHPFSFGTTRSRLVLRAGSMRPGQFALCPHCGHTLQLRRVVGQAPVFAHPEGKPCAEIPLSFLAKAAAEVLGSQVSEGSKVVADGATVLLMPECRLLARLVDEPANAGAAAVGRTVNVASWAGQGEALLSHLGAAEAALKSTGQAGAEAPAHVAPVVVETAPAPVVAPKVEPVKPSPAPAASGQQTQAVLTGGTGTREPKPYVPSVLPARMAGNLRSRGVQFEWLPDWLTEPVPAGARMSALAVNWQLMLAILLLERGTAGKSWSRAWLVQCLTTSEPGTTFPPAVHPSEVAMLDVAVGEFIDRLVAEGYLEAGKLSKGTYWHRRTSKAFRFADYRPA